MKEDLKTIIFPLNMSNSKAWAIFPEENEWNELTIDFGH